MSQRILWVDPDQSDREDAVATVRAELSDLDLQVRTAGTLADAEEGLTLETAAVVTEYDLPDGTGIDVVRAAQEACPDAGCVLYTDADPGRIDTAALGDALTEYVGKESLFGAERLADLLRSTVEGRTGADYPLPGSERERIDALRSYDLDDPGLVASLDRVADLAARHFGVDAASVNLIEDHSQEFLACHGAADDWETMDREDSICTFTILEDDGAMVVEDVTEDPRFESRSETLLSMGIRSYMGANLVTSSGLVIGPLCVYDDEPRSFSADDEAYLKDLAAVAMDLIEAHARQADEPSVERGAR